MKAKAFIKHSQAFSSSFHQTFLYKALLGATLVLETDHKHLCGFNQQNLVMQGLKDWKGGH